MAVLLGRGGGEEKEKKEEKEEKEEMDRRLEYFVTFSPERRDSALTQQEFGFKVSKIVCRIFFFCSRSLAPPIFLLLNFHFLASFFVKIIVIILSRRPFIGFP